MAKKKKSFAWSPVRKLMKKSGANIVARDAVELLIIDLEKTATTLTKKLWALHDTQNARRSPKKTWT